MALAKISRNNQIIIYLAILILVVIFFFYFFRQALIMPSGLSELQVTTKQTGAVINRAAININLDLFGTPKFMKLRSEVAPTTSFQSGKRNPFEPQ
ncbi:MAG: hypothetical protein PHE24_01455 [Patescibacteria group bacterium]|nr:hypothetical protein [Patescibacteria group bacterium]